MPPNEVVIKKPASPIAGGTVVNLTNGEQIIASFYGLDGAALALKEAGFDQHEEMATIIKAIRASLAEGDYKTTVGALRQFRSVLKEIAKSQGFFTKEEKSRVFEDGQGGLVREIEQVQRLADRLRKANENVKEELPYQIHPPLLTEGSEEVVEADWVDGETGEQHGPGTHGSTVADRPSDPGPVG